MKHVYIQGSAYVVPEQTASERVASGEWYICNAEHVNVPSGVPSDEAVIFYHRNDHHRTPKVEAEG